MKKYTEGRALIIVIIVMALLLILAPAIVLSSNTEVNQTTRYENVMQAYLYARSGIDSALGWLVEEGNINEDFKDEDSYDGTAFLYGNLNSFSLSASELTDESDIQVSVMEDSDGIHLSSIGTYNGSTRQIDLLLQLTTVNNSSNEMPAIDKAVFAMAEGDYANPVIYLQGSSSIIIGDVGANTTGEGSIYFFNDGSVIGNEFQDGSIYLYADDDNVIYVKRGDIEDMEGDVVTGEPYWNYPDFDFPVFPSYPEHPFYKVTLGTKEYILVENGDLDFSVGKNLADGLTLPLNGNYEFGDIIVDKNSIGTLDLGGEDRYIVCDNLDISNGHLNLITDGGGTLTIYVRNTIELGAGSTLNTGSEGDLVEDLNVFYAGTEIPNIHGSTEFRGSLITETSDFELRGDNGVMGHIIVGGENVLLQGSASLETRIIYAPHANVTITGGAEIIGSIVAQTFQIQGTGSVEYRPLDFSSLPDGVLPEPGEPGSSNGETTEVITSYYWQ